MVKLSQHLLFRCVGFNYLEYTQIQLSEKPILKRALIMSLHNTQKKSFRGNSTAYIMPCEFGNDPGHFGGGGGVQ